MKSMLVRMDRQASAASEVGSLNTAKSRSGASAIRCRLACESMGTTPSSGAPTNASAASGLLTVLSMDSTAKASSRPKTRPTTMPTLKFTAKLGLAAARGGVARSRIRTLLAFSMPVRLISLWR